MVLLHRLNDRVQEALDEAKESILAHRISSEIHLEIEDFDDAIKISEVGLERVTKSELNTGKRLAQ